MRQKMDHINQRATQEFAAIQGVVPARTVPAAIAALDPKISAATGKFDAQETAYTAAIIAHKAMFRPSDADKSALGKARQLFQLSRRILDKLQAARRLIDKIVAEDALRLAEAQEKKNELDTKIAAVGAAEPTEAQLKEMQLLAQLLVALHQQLLENSKRLLACQRIAESYNDAQPQYFADHWLDIASVLIEQEDFYGFKGEIVHRDLGTQQMPETGLVGHSVAYTAVLKEDEFVRYTRPGTKLKIEHDTHGFVTDSSPYDKATPEWHKNFAAIKMAELLLLDRVSRKETKIFLKGSNADLDQSRRVVAALMVLADQAGIVLNEEDIVVDIPRWKNRLGSTADSMDKVQEYMPQITAAITTVRAQNEFREKYTKLVADRDQDQVMLDQEPLHTAKRPGGP